MQINLTPDPSLLAIMVIFIVNYLVVRKFFLQPVNAVLEAREHETKTADGLYETAMARFQEETSRMESQLLDAKREAALVREKFRGEAGAHRNSVLERTGNEAKQLVSDADQSLTRDVASARDAITRDAESLARLAAERILGRSL